MIKREEDLFTEGFICALSYLNVAHIPFGGYDFRNGIEKLKDYLISETDSIPAIEKIRPLFTKRPINGNYERMKQALESYNGSKVSFSLDNPKWENANIRVAQGLASKILKESKCNLPSELMINAAKKFCEGAGVNYTL